MKRSEMIQIIKEVIMSLNYNRAYLGNNCPTPETWYEAEAKTILNKIEKKGMLPPSFDSEENGWSYYIDGDVLWEPEND